MRSLNLIILLMFLTSLLIVIGLFTILKPVLRIIQALYYHFKPLELKKLYGEGWAIVTGASDGIGFGFCQQLAAQGYKICLVSRSKQKMLMKIKELKEQFGQSLECKFIQADFKSSHNQGFFQKIFFQLDKIQPKILVNNVGIAEVIRFENQSISSMKDIISVNCLPMAALTSYFIQRCKKEGYRGGVVNLSSYSWVEIVPYISVYESTKAFNDIFSRSIGKQQKNIDLLSVRAMQVISSVVKKQKSFLIATSRECALGSLKCLGKQKYTAGHLNHEIVSSITTMLPGIILDKIVQKEAQKVYADYHQKKQ